MIVFLSIWLCNTYTPSYKMNVIFLEGDGIPDFAPGGKDIYSLIEEKGIL